MSPFVIVVAACWAINMWILIDLALAWPDASRIDLATHFLGALLPPVSPAIMAFVVIEHATSYLSSF
ncbi:hypothetical protein TW83_09870 [Paracoccus sp. S4493]|uniref:hypothetical protein n=1 Tax=Paracoccus sp. S4493 TaxID=579490 RepID=UPI0005FA2CFA|nr:hypothetical protein [Paracoccus sp. S4493]KJZ31223.1 hypothetical protein TW83_09870 [Paracoccus sp. S4493]